MIKYKLPFFLNYAFFLNLLLCSHVLIPYAKTQKQLEGKNVINISYNLSLFKEPNQKTFADICVSVDASGLKFVQIAPNKFQASAKLGLFLQPLTKGSTGSNVAHELLSPIISDTLPSTRRMLLLHNFRVNLEPDSLEVNVSVMDNHVTNSSVTSVVKKVLVPQSNPDKFSFSSIVFLDKFDKSDSKTAFHRHGFNIIPLATNSYLENKDTLKAYFEYYQLTQSTKLPYFIHTYIKETNSNDDKKLVQVSYKAKMPKDYEASFISLPLKNLASNTYSLFIEIKDQSGLVIHQTQELFFFYTTNEVFNFTESENNISDYDKLYAYSEKDLNDILPKLKYISSSTEIDFLPTLKDFESKKNYFVNFWKKRQTDVKNKTKPWHDYLNRIRYSNQKFKSNFQEGWLTDRGRVMITYGPPSDVQSFPVEHDKLPYELWTYNKLKSQNGVNFIFIDSDLSTNSYPLLHSTLIGETYNANWRSNVVKKREKDYQFNSSEDQINDEFKETIPRTTGSPR